MLHFIDDPDEADRAPAGDAVVGNVALAIDGLLARLPEPEQPWRPCCMDS